MKTIHIKNLEKYQPSYKDGRRLLWIRWDIDALVDYKFCMLTPAEKWFFIGLVCLETQAQEPIPYDEGFIANRLGYPKNSISNTLVKLQKLGLVVTDCNNEGKSLSLTDNTDRHTDNTYTEMLNLWNEFAVKQGLVKIAKLTPERKAKLKARVRDGMDLKEVIATAKQQPFLLGQNPRGWKMDFDWLITNSTNYVKVLEGRYKQSRGQEGRQL